MELHIKQRLLSEPTQNLTLRIGMTTLNTLPHELIIHVYGHLSPGQSACVGLTCKTLYALHREIHGSVPLSSRCTSANATTQGPKLYQLLEEWYPPGFELCWCGHGRLRAVRRHRDLNRKNANVRGNRYTWEMARKEPTARVARCQFP